MDKVTSALAKVNQIILIRIPPEQDLLTAIYEVLAERGIKSGVIICGVGSMSNVTLRNPYKKAERFPITDNERIYRKLDGPAELVQLSGNISTLDERTVVHAHASISLGSKDGVVYGGHLEKGSFIYSTAEIVIAAIDLQVTRKLNSVTLMPELFFNDC